MNNKFFTEEERSVDIWGNISQILEANGYKVLEVGGNSHKSLKLLNDIGNVDLVLLDILYNGGEIGNEVIPKIRENLNLPLDHKIRFSEKPDGHPPELPLKNFLIKPLGKGGKTSIKVALFNTRDKFNNDTPPQVNNSIQIRDKGYLVQLDPKEIIYAQADGLYTKIITTNKTYMIRDILKNFEAKLSEHEFSRVHKSYLVNISFIQSFNSKKLLINNQYIPIRRGLYKYLKEITKYSSSRNS